MVTAECRLVQCRRSVRSPATGGGRSFNQGRFPMTQLLDHALRGKRDLLRLRQRARQLARALGFAPADQALIAAAAFQLGCSASAQARRCRLTFHLREGKLQAVTSQDAPDLARVQLEWVLPGREPSLAPTDLPWAMRELERLTPLDLFEELRQQNLDLLQALHELQSCRTALGRLRPRRGDAA
jgi:hypothetical protein